MRTRRICLRAEVSRAQTDSPGSRKSKLSLSYVFLAFWHQGIGELGELYTFVARLSKSLEIRTRWGEERRGGVGVGWGRVVWGRVDWRAVGGVRVGSGGMFRFAQVQALTCICFLNILASRYRGTCGIVHFCLHGY